MRFLVPTTEILIIAVCLYYFFSFFWKTRAMDLFLGLAACVGIFLVVGLFDLPVLQSLVVYLINIGGFALIVIFQPELRLALSKLTLKTQKYTETSTFDRFLEDLSETIYFLSEKRIGALIALENLDNLDDYAEQAVMLNANYSPELVQSIFLPTTPLHDGAIIVRETTILSAATILPLAIDVSQLSRAMGTRHRAALGLTQLTDAIAIIVSEETGKVSIAREGMITRGVKIDRFKGILRSIFNSDAKIPSQSEDWMDKLKKWLGL